LFIKTSAIFTFLLEGSSTIAYFSHLAPVKKNLQNTDPYKVWVYLSAEGLSSIYQRKENRMNRYELTVILQNQNRDVLVTKTKDILEKHGVTVVSEDSWGIKKLAYQIEGDKEGYYFFAIVESLPENVEKVIAEFGLNAGFLRYLFVKLPELKTA
jgi:small subunit ribosomal protein S6